MAKDIDKLRELFSDDPVRSGARLRSDASGLSCGPSRFSAKQEFKDECDINKIMARFAKSGELTHVNRQSPVFADVSGLGSYQESLAVVARAEESFMRLPGEIRRSLGNDPSKLLPWLQDPANVNVAMKFGLLTAPPVETVQKVEVVNAAAPPVVTEKKP